MDGLPSNLFEAVSTKDLDGLIYLYALSGRGALTRIARLTGVSPSILDQPFSLKERVNRYRSSSGCLNDDQKIDLHQTELKLWSVSRDLHQILDNIKRKRFNNLVPHDKSDNDGINETEMLLSSHIQAGMSDSSLSNFTETSQKTPFLPKFLVGPSITLSHSASELDQVSDTLYPQLPRMNSWVRYNPNNALYNSSLNDIVDHEIEMHLINRASSMTNTRPKSSFVMYAHEPNGSTSANPIFDGAVANATPQGIQGGGGGSGTILHLACDIDSPLTLAILLVMGADPSCRHTVFRRTIVHEAACVNAPNSLRFLLEQFPSSLPCTTEDDASIDECKDEVLYERKSAIKHGLEFGDDSATTPNVIARRGLSFVKTLSIILDLIRQVQENNLSEIAAARILINKVPLAAVAQSFLEAACSLNEDNSATLDGHGNTALHWASFKNSFPCAKILLSHGAIPNSKAKTSEWTPLHDAAYSNAVDTLSLLIAAGGDVNSKAKSGATPLCFAAQEDGPEAAELLLKAGADPTVRCIKGNGSLGDEHSQHVYNHVSRFSGYTPLHYCAHYNAYKTARTILKFSNAVRGLSSHSPLLEIPDLNNRLPIHIAVSRGNSDVLRQFLHFGQIIETTSYSHEENSVASIDIHHSASGQDSQENRSLISISDDEDVVMDGDASNVFPIPQSRTLTFSPVSVSSLALRSMIPLEPLKSPKPWNCISQRSIDECKIIIQDMELYWSPERHSIFHPRDREAARELLRVGKRLEQEGTGLFLELWPLVLSFCGRGWFEPKTDNPSKQIVS
jgi:ankyrin repeat protein